MTINAINSSLPETGKISTKHTKELREKFTLLKDELGEKIKNNDTEPSFSIGNSSFTINEWKNFLQNFDKQEEDIKKEIEEEIENREEDKNSIGESEEIE